MKQEETKKLILTYREEGKVCLQTIEGLMVARVNDFIQQPVDGILYDLNRGIETTLTIMPKKRWINDIAVAVTVVALKKRIDELEAELKLEQASNRILDGVIKWLHKTLHEEQQKNKILQDEVDKFPGEGLVSDVDWPSDGYDKSS